LFGNSGGCWPYFGISGQINLERNNALPVFSAYYYLGQSVVLDFSITLFNKKFNNFKKIKERKVVWNG